MKFWEGEKEGKERGGEGQREGGGGGGGEREREKVLTEIKIYLEILFWEGEKDNYFGG